MTVIAANSAASMNIGRLMPRLTAKATRTRFEDSAATDSRELDGKLETGDRLFEEAGGTPQ
jgi:hypothetical protein